MKKTLLSILLSISFLGATSVFGQFNTPINPNKNVTLITPSNNVVLGPLPPTTTIPTNLYINSSSTTGYGTILSIDDNSVNPSGPTWRMPQLNFNSGGINKYTIYYGETPSICGSNLFHIMPATTGPGIHMSLGGITFSNNSQGSGCGSALGVGKYVFDGMIGSGTGINIGYYGQGAFAYPPAGYTLANSGTSFFRDKVVIGTTNSALPTGSHKLYVGGSIICEELVVKLQANWPDFVFAPSYKLMSLSDVKTFIAANSHLPEVPSACEIEKNGVATGDMLTIQMKKIEELTLYLIQMEERVKELEAQNKVLTK
jgi:hypothetical protein